MTDSTSPATREEDAFSRELGEFLLEMSITVHRYAMYPPGHPSLEPLVGNLVKRLRGLFTGRDILSVGVAHRQLIVEGVATDRKHPVLSDLARRLHGHQLGAFSFEEGVTAAEVAGLLEKLAESERAGVPLGHLPPDQFPQWAHASLLPVGYDQLELHGAEAEEAVLDRANALWLDLAKAALGLKDPDTDAAHDVGTIARSICESERGPAFDSQIAGYLRGLAEQLRLGRSREAMRIRTRMSELIEKMDEGTLHRLVDFGGNKVHRRQFFLDANQCLAVEAIMKTLDCATRWEGQSISDSMSRVLDKLAIHASSGAGQQRDQAESALRENIESVIESWGLDDSEPDAQAIVLDALARSAPVLSLQDMDQGRPLTGAGRLMQMSLEIDAYGPLVQSALAELVRIEGAGLVLDLIEEVTGNNRVADQARRYLTSPDEFRTLLSEGRVDERALKILVRLMGASAVEPLLDVLADSDDRAMRRRVFDSLVGLGTLVAPRAIERLSDSRWFVLRNMLALLARLDHRAHSFDVRPYTEHPDPRVRREAFPVALRRENLREAMLAAALSDEDERMVRMGLLELRSTIPEIVVPALVNRVVMEQDRSEEIRSFALKVLRHSKAPLALRALLDMTTSGKTMLGKARLAPKSPTLLSALNTMAQAWPAHADTKALLELAAKSRDAEIRGAVRAGLSKAAREPAS